MKLIELVGKYIGRDKIIEAEDAQRKTFFGKKVIRVFFDKEAKEYPEEVLKDIVTKEPIDLSGLRELRIKGVAEKVLAVLAESELPVFNPVGANIQYLCETILPQSIQENKYKACGKLFKKDYYEINLSDIDAALKDGKENNKAR